MHTKSHQIPLANKARSLSLGCPIPSRPQLFHQEDRSFFLARSRPLLKKVLTNAPSGRRTSLLPSSSTSQHFGCQRHRHRNILIALTKRSHWVDTVNLVTHRGICDTLLAHSRTIIRAVERESSVQPLFSCGPSAKLSWLIDIVSWLSAFWISL